MDGSRSHQLHAGYGGTVDTVNEQVDYGGSAGRGAEMFHSQLRSRRRGRIGRGELPAGKLS